MQTETWSIRPGKKLVGILVCFQRFGGFDAALTHGFPLAVGQKTTHGSASAEDYHQLIQLVQKTVAEKFAVKLETEIELLGEWQD